MESEFVDWAQKCIAKSLPAAKAREKEERRSGKKLTNGPVARLLAPPFKKNALEQHRANTEGKVLVEDSFSLLRGMHAPAHVILSGKTRFLDARREWPVFKSVHDAALANGVSLDKLYNLFQHTYAAVAIVRVKESSGKNYVLAGIRAANLGSFYGSAVSFPGGLVDPGETLIQAAKRELKEEAGYLARDARQSPFAAFTTDKAASTSFGLFLDTPGRHLVRKTVSREMAGRQCVWIPEAALDALIFNGDAKDVEKRFRRAGIRAEKLSMALDTADIYKQLRKADY